MKLLFVLCGIYCETFIIKNDKADNRLNGINTTTDRQVDSFTDTIVYCIKYKETDEIKEPGHYCSNVRYYRGVPPSSYNAYCIGLLLGAFYSYCFDHVYIGTTPMPSQSTKPIPSQTPELVVKTKKQTQVNYFELFLSNIIFE